ncbi:MAG: hypothetical protein JWO37_830 [Acidimicrobiales bacterium]|jgi:hypothetical protein|nr:hypothetical protein [Acidimicrobiales bacterium]
MKRLKYAAIAAGALFLVIVFLVVVLNPDPKATVNRPFTAQENVKPPAAGVPPSAKSVSGIYRSIGQDVLQLRADGQFTLTDKHGADGGVFGLVDGRFDVKTTRCGDVRGTYVVIVTGPQEAGRAALQFTVQDDGCLDRRTTLTSKPWVYANS